MKKILIPILLLAAVWSGPRFLEMNSVSAQITGFPGNLIPFTNQIAFTNTVVAATNLSSLQFADVTTLLLQIQTNIEETLPALALVTTNATPIFPAPVQSLGAIPPVTSGPPGFFLTPTGSPTGRSTPQLPSFSVQVGTNVVTIDQPTFQALVNLRDQLQQTLPLLQALNGTAPSPTNAGTVTTILLRPLPGVTNMITPPITNGFTTPLTNGLTMPGSNFPSPF